MWRWLWWWRPPCWRRTVLVNLKDDPTTAIRGVLWVAWGPWITIRHPELCKGGAPPAPMDGEVVLERRNVAFFQVP